MDAPAGLNPKRDSTLALAFAAQERGHKVHYFTPNDISARDGEIIARARALEVHPGQTPFFSEGEPQEVSLEKAADVVLIRQEPPYDLQYLTTCWLLERLHKPRVLNNPTAMRNRPEKLFPLALPHYCPPTLISRDMAAIRDFHTQQGEIILKPLFEFGGRSIFHIRRDDYNLQSLLELMLSKSREPVIAQAFLPAVREQEVRALLIDGELVGAYNRIPLSDSIRANSVLGGDIATVSLSPKQQEICAAVGEICSKEGFFFVGLDLIDDKLIEVNTTCPTGIKAYFELTGTDIAPLFWQRVEAGR